MRCPPQRPCHSNLCVIFWPFCDDGWISWLRTQQFSEVSYKCQHSGRDLSKILVDVMLQSNEKVRKANMKLHSGHLEIYIIL